MCWREVARGGDAVAFECALAAMGQPIIGPRIVIVSREDEVLMIAFEADDVIRIGALEVDKVIDGLTALRPTVDVVAKEDELHRAAGRVVDALGDQHIDLGVAAVDVADAIGPCHAVIWRLDEQREAKRLDCALVRDRAYRIWDIRRHRLRT